MDSDLTKEVERLRLRIARQDMEISSIKVSNDKLADAVSLLTNVVGAHSNTVESLIQSAEIINEILKEHLNEG